ncbi:MAG: heme lyase CcmF/NrfE family subunit [Parasphingorhabdus sp.]|nr:heme lyase CcmF/NrfE family subunit [Parasphingorhabdus sp.]
MIAETGLAALWLAAALALLQLVIGAIGGVTNRDDMTRAVRPVAVAQGLLAAVSFAMLILLFLRSDMSVALVANNSHTAKPWLYKFAGTWGNHEGSMLLWVMVMALSGAFLALFSRSLKPATFVTTLAAQAFISLGFYAFLLISSNPFERLSPAPEDGAGLNPLLQDPGLAFHPPTLYLGYVGLSVAFSFAVGAMLTRDVGPAFAQAMRPWVLGAWIFLTLGITAGSYWAYYELGWGGWWFWDPVENASLMPWLAATALLHSVTVLATRDGLRAWTLMLAVVAFSMSMIGTFLVRSGILTSVHAFAVDPERGSFILGLLAIYIGGAMALYALRVGTVREGAQFEPISREGALVANNLLLTAILGIVLVGTLYPLFVEATTGEKLSVGAPYFNLATGPIALLLVVIMAAGPVLRWRRDGLSALATRTAVPLLITALALFLLLLLAPPMTILPLLALALAAGIAVASFAPLWRRNLRRTPLHVYGMVLAHLGIAVALVGMASESSFSEERLVAAAPGDRVTVNKWTLQLQAIEPVAGPNWTALEGRMTAAYEGDTPITLHPQNRTFSEGMMQTTEAALLTRWNGQLYVVLGEEAQDGRWQLRIWWKPFVTLIWLGGILVAFGGLIAMAGRVRRGGKKRARRIMQERWA